MKELIQIGIIGDYDERKPSHLATDEAIKHCAAYLNLEVMIDWMPTESLTGKIDDLLKVYDGLWCAPGSPYRNYQGALNAIRFAREHNYPFIGTCGGFQHAVMEYAQNVLGIAEAYHEEYNPDASTFFISSLSCSLKGITNKIFLRKGSRTHLIYGTDEIEERYNCSFGLNVEFQNTILNGGFQVVGTDDHNEVRILELPSNRFYVATLFQPQLSSTPDYPHRLITEYLLAAKHFHKIKIGNSSSIIN